MSTRNKIIKEASALRDRAEERAHAAFLTPDEPKAWGLVGDLQRLSNDACESQWPVKRLKERLSGLRKEVAA